MMYQTRLTHLMLILLVALSGCPRKAKVKSEQQSATEEPASPRQLSQAELEKLAVCSEAAGPKRKTPVLARTFDNLLRAVAVHPRRLRLAAAETGFSVQALGLSRVWHTELDHAMVYSLAFTSDGKVLATGGMSPGVQLWRFPDDGKTDVSRLNTLKHGTTVYALSIAPDGQTLVSGDSQGQLRLWSLPEGALRGEWNAHADAYDITVAFSPDGQQIVSGSYKEIKLWSRAGKLLRTLKVGGNANKVAWSPGGDQIAVALNTGLIHMVDAKALAKKAVLKGHDGAVRDIAFHPEGKLIYSGGQDKTIRVWDLDTTRQRHKLEAHTDAVSALALDSSGTLLVSVGPDKQLLIWCAPH